MFLPFKDSLPKASFPMMTFSLIAINVALYFALSANEAASFNTIINYGVVPYELTHSGAQCVPAQELGRMFCGTSAEIQAMYPGVELPPTWMTVVASMFLHADLMHLLGNMLFLFVFGGALENALGRLSYGIFYLVGGIAAILAQMIWDVNAAIPMVGASGAIAAVQAGYLVLFPSAKVWSLFIVFPMRVRAVWVIGTWLVLQVWLAWAVAGAGIQGGVAVFAHLGGFAAGAALTYLLISKEEIADFRRNARIASGLMVEPLQPYEPGVMHASQRYVPQGQAAQQAYVAPQPQQAYVAPQPGAPAFVPQAGHQQNLWSPPPPAVPQQQYPVQATPPPPPPNPYASPPSPAQQRVVPPDPFAPKPAQQVPPDPFAPPPQRHVAG